MTIKTTEHILFWSKDRTLSRIADLDRLTITQRQSWTVQREREMLMNTVSHLESRIAALPEPIRAAAHNRFLFEKTLEQLKTFGESMETASINHNLALAEGRIEDAGSYMGEYTRLFNQAQTAMQALPIFLTLATPTDDGFDANGS